jgi:diguanylate cyclase (GGDEF)-like protein/PAS domain S-box-containing protein
MVFNLRLRLRNRLFCRGISGYYRVQAAHFQECVRRKSPYIHEETIEFPNGIRSWSTMLSPVLNGGAVVQIIGSRKDITEKQQAIAELQESEERYSSLFENNHSVMLIIDPGDGRIVDANPAACAYYGYSRDKIKTLNIHEMNTLSREQIQAEMEKALKEHRNLFFFQHRLSNGEIRDVEVYSGPIHFSGQLFLYSIVHDVTERKKAETELYQEKERLNVTLHSIGDGVITTDICGNITLISEETGQTGENAVEKVIATGKIVELANHTVLIAKDGSKRFIADSGAPIRDGEGRVFGVALVFRDVTERKMREEEIRFLSFHDNLTGLYNRAFLEIEKQRLDHEEFLPLSLVIGDVNGLKLTNDIFGHEVGDRLLKTIAELLVAEFRDEGIVARWGGDEFVIILPRTSNDKATAHCQNIQKRCGMMPEDPIRPNITFGASTKEENAQEINLVLKEAEDIMYRRFICGDYPVDPFIPGFIHSAIFGMGFKPGDRAAQSVRKGHAWFKSGYEAFNLRIIKDYTLRFIPEQTTLGAGQNGSQKVGRNMDHLEFSSGGPTDRFVNLIPG